MSVTSIDPDGAKHHLQKSSITTGIADEIAQILDDHYGRYVHRRLDKYFVQRAKA